MKAFLTILLVASVCAYVSALDRDEREEKRDREKKQQEIDKLKKRVKDLNEWIDKLNEHVCQSGGQQTAVCKDDESTSTEKLAKCVVAPIMSPQRTTVKQNFYKRSESKSIVAVGTTGARWLCGLDYELDVKSVSRNDFTLEIRSDDLIAPTRVRHEYFSCPEALNFKS